MFIVVLICLMFFVLVRSFKFLASLRTFLSRDIVVESGFCSNKRHRLVLVA